MDCLFFFFFLLSLGGDAGEVTGIPAKQVCVSPDFNASSFPLPQRCLDWNRDILKRELALTEKDIIDLPALFKMDENHQARAFFPNMVRYSSPNPSCHPQQGANSPRRAQLSCWVTSPLTLALSEPLHSLLGVTCLALLSY